MSSDTTIKCNKKGITMKYYITDANFNVLSVHPDRESAKAVWDVNWKAGVDVYLESEENHLKNIEWAKAYKQRAIERKKRREDKAINTALEVMEEEYKVLDMLVKEDLKRVKPMSFEFEEAAQREAEEEDNK
jgi:hypothetical protein